ncbi:hypothetical protein ACJX0J_012638, partial [Zea mays]
KINLVMANCLQLFGNQTGAYIWQGFEQVYSMPYEIVGFVLENAKGLSLNGDLNMHPVIAGLGGVPNANGDSMTTRVAADHFSQQIKVQTCLSHLTLAQLHNQPKYEAYSEGRRAICTPLQAAVAGVQKVSTVAHIKANCCGVHVSNPNLADTIPLHAGSELFVLNRSSIDLNTPFLFMFILHVLNRSSIDLNTPFLFMFILHLLNRSSLDLNTPFLFMFILHVLNRSSIDLNTPFLFMFILHVTHNC